MSANDPKRTSARLGAWLRFRLLNHEVDSIFAEWSEGYDSLAQETLTNFYSSISATPKTAAFERDSGAGRA
jgi:hypothetical protein